MLHLIHVELHHTLRNVNTNGGSLLSRACFQLPGSVWAVVLLTGCSLPSHGGGGEVEINGEGVSIFFRVCMNQATVRSYHGNPSPFLKNGKLERLRGSWENKYVRISMGSEKAPCFWGFFRILINPPLSTGSPVLYFTYL